MVYEKTRVAVKASSGQPDSPPCSFCDRPKSTVICSTCSRTFGNMRARKICSQHPKQLNTMDLTRCPDCRTSVLLEVRMDEIPPAVAIAAMNPENVPGTGRRRMESMGSEYTEEEVEVDLPVNANDNLPCICARRVGFTVCNDCGELMDGRMYLPCQVHPNNQDGWKMCPNPKCNSTTSLEEVC